MAPATIALAEALGHGLACVTTRGVAISRAIEEAQAGLVVATDAEAIAASLAKILCDKELRTRPGANARALTEREYSLDGMGRRPRGLYVDLLGRAVKEVYAEGKTLTPDQGGTASTTEFCEAVGARL